MGCKKLGIGAYLTPLKKIPNPKGDIFHGLKCTEDSFISFGEAYFTHINFNDIKGWKKHSKMALNLVVPIGNVRFYVYNQEIKDAKIFTIGVDNYERLTVPPGLWVAFRGIADPTSLILNIASIEHNADDALIAELERFPEAGLKL